MKNNKGGLLSQVKVSIITLHTVNNYGSVMQTYATQQIFKRFGCEVEFVDFWRESNTPREKARRLLNSATLRKLKPLWGINQKTRNITLKALERYIQKHVPPTWKFIQDNVRLTPNRYYSFKELQQNPPLADVYVTGSDQVWNSEWNQGIEKAYFLDYAPEGKKRISFAASIGKTTLDKAEVEETVALWKKYAAISVREESAVALMNSFGLNANLILDPTLMLTSNEWKEISSKRKVLDEPYILVYQLHENPEFDLYLKKLAEKTKYAIVRIGYSHSDRKKPGKCIMLPSVPDFLSLFCEATCVLTDSFHATAFALNLGIDFISILPSNYGTRIESITRLTGTEDRILRSYDDLTIVDKKIDKESVQRTLSEERKKGLDFLKSAIEVH